MTTGAPPGATTAARRGAGWWTRSVLMVALPVAIGVLAARHGGTAMGVGGGLMAFVGAIFVFHPDTLGWKLSLTPSFSNGPDTGPSELWQVWARLSGLFLLVVCAIAAATYRPPPPPQDACAIVGDQIQCPWDSPAPTASPG
jgi:hypothetical protein